MNIEHEHCGVKQGWSVSPVLYSLFVNDYTVKSVDKGLSIWNEVICILFYVEGIVPLLSDNEDWFTVYDVYSEQMA